jgi:peptidoglycan/LPS O-acetylase OafA/YrhL
MAKGLLIMLIVFAVIGIFGWGMNKVGNAPEAKKQRFLKFYFMGYGILLIATAIYNLFSHESPDFFIILQGIVGVIMILLAVLGKLDKQSK